MNNKKDVLKDNINQCRQQLTKKGIVFDKK